MNGFPFGTLTLSQKHTAMIETYMLEQLAALAEYKTLSRVAETLHISQPAISRSMQKLEDELGVPIFERTKNRITLNALGEIAAKHAKGIMSAHNDMVQAVRDAERRMRTFAYGSIAPAPIWELSPILSQLYMGMTVSADLQETEDILRARLDSGDYNLIVLTHPLEAQHEPGDSLYFSQPFIRENLSLLVSNAHRLARRKSLKLKDLAGEKILIHNKIGFWFSVCKEKIPNASFLEQNDLSTLSEIANASDLPTFFTNMSDRIGICPANKRVIPITDAEVNVQFWCVCRAEKRREYAAIFNAIRRLTETV